MVSFGNMSKGSTLYRYKIELSDVDRSVYDSLDFRVAMHASESEAFLVTRVLAYVLNFQDGLVFSQGLAVPDEPALSVPGTQGGVDLWVDIGNPSPRRIHKASKAARQVRIYTYKDPESLLREVASEEIHRAERIELYSLDPKFIESLAREMKKDNDWSVILNDSELTVTAGEEAYHATVKKHRLVFG